MDIKDAKIKKGMTRHEVNELISEWILLEDSIYQGNKYKHNWKCKCGNMIERRMWNTIKTKHSIRCKGCKNYSQELRYKTEVEKTGEYEYIRNYRSGDKLPNGNVAKVPHIQIKHKYCGSMYTVTVDNFINRKQRCGKCCQKYEDSFAHHIEVELGLKLEDIWDFEKNTLNPYHISKSSGKQVWIKCQEKDYHESYNINVYSFKDGNKCPYCSNQKVHPKDSFAQYHIDNTEKDFLDKYWDWDKNTLNPWEIAPNTHKKVWIKCQNEEINELNGLMKKDYHGSYEIRCSNFTNRKRCSYCNPKNKKYNKVHPYDSFGYHHFDKVMSWHPDNKISPFRVTCYTRNKYKFICETCENIWESSLGDISCECWCPNCSASKGENKIKNLLDANNIIYINNQPYFNDLIGLGGYPLRPDFILPEHKIWIEYDGEFHYRKMYDTDGHEKIRIHDKRKDEYARKHGWKMIRIPYWEFDNIENILEKIKIL